MSNLDTIRKFIIHFEQGNAGDLLDMMTDAIIWNMVGDQILSGKEEISKIMQELKFRGVPDFKTGLLLEAGDRVIHTHRIYSTMQSGESFNRQWCNMYQFLGDKISYIESYPIDLTEDHLKLAAQKNVLL